MYFGLNWSPKQEKGLGPRCYGAPWEVLTSLSSKF